MCVLDAVITTGGALRAVHAFYVELWEVCDWPAAYDIFLIKRDVFHVWENEEGQSVFGLSR